VRQHRPVALVNSRALRNNMELHSRFKDRQRAFNARGKGAAKLQARKNRKGKFRLKLIEKKKEKRKEQLKEFANELRENMTKEELYLWEVLKTWTGEFICKAQHSIAGRIADFFFPKHNLIVEVDGGYHFKMEQRIKDHMRTRHLNKCGLKVVRFTNSQVMDDREGILEAIKVGLTPVVKPPFKHSLLLEGLGQ
jgi:very-short-patch-repair endonuclease